MVKINGKPLLEHLVNKLNKAGISEIIVNIHKDYDKIFKYFGTRLLYLYEPVLLGEAGTVQILDNWLGEEYIVMNGDTLTNVDITKLIDESRDGHCYFIRTINPINGHYTGTTLVNKNEILEISGTTGHAEGDHFIEGTEYYFDCGTPAKLAKARRYFAKHPA